MPEKIAGASEAYQVLARKYRPRRFDDLIGHEAMVRTLSNAFASGRIAHAFVLTGVRGVGKTTTARILARALNYVGPNGEDNGPQIDMPEDGLHCQAIAESRHPDVLEMDAASRTGVGDIRDLIEGVRYAPVEARYKVYIIDEVHMLSTQAFNALLKTLEEPPPHVKFIFATTEIRKLPVTVLSRCQRFDLRRIDPTVLVDFLGKIAAKENTKVDLEGLAMIARAAEGSVRDGLSLLDQAIIQHMSSVGGADAEGLVEVTGEEVRAMLGLADRSQTWGLLQAALQGDAKTALTMFRDQYDAGAEPSIVLRDMLELVHLVTRVKAAGGEAASHGPAGEADAERARNTADGLQLNALTRAWALLMRGLSETLAAPDPSAAGEMALIRLCFAADLPTPDEALRALRENRVVSAGGASSAAGSTSGGTSGASSEGGVEPTPAGNSLASRERPADQPSASLSIAAAARALEPKPSSPPPSPGHPRIASLADIAHLAGVHRNAKLRTELEGYVHVISFEQGRIEVRLHERAPADLAGRLMRRLKEWTGEHWVVTVNTRTEGAATLRDTRMAEVMAHPLVKKALEVFPGAEVTAIREPTPEPFTPVDDQEADDQIGSDADPEPLRGEG